MKKVLLSLFLMGAVLLGKAQVILNELYVDPGGNSNEFFELYNTSTIDQDLDCYTLISFYALKSGNSVIKGFYVLDLPSLPQIKGRSYYTGASASPFNYQKVTGSTPSFNWNTLDASGSLKNYQLNAAGTAYTETTPSSINNFFGNVASSTYGSANVAVFLFKNGAYVNGFLGGGGVTSAVPSTINAFPTSSITVSCSGSPLTFSVDWSKIIAAEFSAENAGNDNGYARLGDGYCGTWDKTSSQVNHTPNAANPRSGVINRTPTLTTTQKLICGTQIDFTISAPTSGTAYPVEVQLYIDNGTTSTLDAGDVYVKSYSPLITGGSNNVYSFFSLDPTKKYLLVYRTALGCIDLIAAPNTATGSLTTSQKNYCGRQIDFTISGVTGDLTKTIAFPVEVELYLDANNNGILDEDTVGAVVGTKGLLYENTFTDYTTQIQSISIPEASYGQPVIIVYKTASTCFSKAVVPTAATGSYNTTQKNICGKTVEFSIIGATGDAATYDIYSYPVTVQVYYDNGTIGQLDAADVSQGSLTVGKEQLNTLLNIEVADPTKTLLLVYKSPTGCFVKATTLTPATGTLATTQKSFCGNKVEFSITGATGDLVKYGFPVTVRLFEDKGTIGDYNAGVDVPIAIDPIVINQLNTTSTFNLPYVDRNKPLLVVYEPYASCLITAAVPTAATGALNTTQTMYCGKQIDFAVTGATTTDATNLSLPVEVRLYLDANNNGILDEDTTGATVGTKGLVAMETITSFSPNLKTLQIPAANQGKSYILVYESDYNCFSAAIASGALQSPSQTIANEQVFEKNTVPAKENENSFIEIDLVDNVDNPITLTGKDFSIEVKIFIHNKPDLENSEEITTKSAEIASVGETLQKIPLDTRGDYVTLEYYSARGCLLRTVTLAPVAEAITPVRFSSFTATRNKQNKQQVDLAWTTAMEQNNKGFYLQRKTDGEWKDVAFVFSAAEGGNSSNALTYRFKDQNTYSGVSQYRLQQVDLDGKATYSDVKSLMGEAQASAVLVFPNPAVGGKVNLLFADAAARTIIVSDLSGRVVKQYRSITSNSLSVEGLKAGFYTIKVTDAKGTTVEKIIVQ